MEILVNSFQSSMMASKCEDLPRRKGRRKDSERVENLLADWKTKGETEKRGLELEQEENSLLRPATEKCKS